MTSFLIESNPKKMGHILKCGFIEKSTIFAKSLRNLVKRTNWWDQYFDQVSYKLSKNCGFFNKSTFQNMSDFFNQTFINCINSTLIYNTISDFKTCVLLFWTISFTYALYRIMWVYKYSFTLKYRIVWEFMSFIFGFIAKSFWFSKDIGWFVLKYEKTTEF